VSAIPTKTIVPHAPADEKAFLGEEFLTWLWWRSETGAAEFDIGGGEIVGFTLEAPATLTAPIEGANGKRPEQLLRSGETLRNAEAAAGLRRGKRLTRARLILGDARREWTLGFDGASYTLRGAAIPEPEELLSPDEKPQYQMSAFSDAFAMLDKIYITFLRERLAPTFRTETLPQIRNWAREKIN
jgi:recombination associated protein RdgC